MRTSLRDKNKVLFISLDGTLINTLSGRPVPVGIWDYRVNWNFLNSVRTYCPDLIIIVTCQPNITRGYLSIRSFQIKLDFIRRCLMDFLKLNDVVSRFSLKTDWTDTNGESIIEGLDVRYEKSLMIGSTDWDKEFAEKSGLTYISVEEFTTKYHEKKTDKRNTVH